MNLRSKFIGIILAGILSISMTFTGCSSNNATDENSSNDSSTSTSIPSSDSDASNSASDTAEDQSDKSRSNNDTLSDGDVQIHFIDTGNSDSILIDDGGVAMLIDAGDNDDERAVVNYLNGRGVKDIKYLISTHAHADHAGGLDEVVKKCKVENAYVSNGDADTQTYRDFIMALSDKGLNPSVPLEGKKFKLKNSYFEVFNTNGGSTTNNESLVVLLTHGKDKMLFMGDAEEEVEYEILNKVPDVDLLKLGHHGSHSSTTDAFLDKTKPEYAVILCGRNNKYGHPHRETMRKLKDRGIDVYRTDESGDLLFTSSGNGIKTNSKKGDYNSGSNSTDEYSSDPSYESGYLESNSSDGSDNLKTVYWTKNGKVYHKYRDCSGLRKSKSVLSGTISDSGKPRLCKRCEER